MQDQYSTQDNKKKVGQRCKDPKESEDSRVASKARQAGDLPSVKLFSAVTSVKQRRQTPDERDEKNSANTRISPYKNVGGDKNQNPVGGRTTHLDQNCKGCAKSGHTLSKGFYSTDPS